MGHPIEYLHIAAHASAAGLELADGLVDGNWLSERLEGVRVLLLASCESDGIGDWLGVVPCVITLSEDIPNEDAAALAQHFWHGIGLGKEPGEALDEALAYCPPAVEEYVVGAGKRRLLCGLGCVNSLAGCPRGGDSGWRWC